MVSSNNNFFEPNLPNQPNQPNQAIKQEKFCV